MTINPRNILTLTACILAFGIYTHGLDYELVDLGTLPGGLRSGALAINEDGVIAGFASGTYIGKHPVIWVNGVIQDLGAPPGFEVGEAVGVNEAGQAAVVGEGNPQSYRGFLWSEGDWTDLGTLPGRAECIPEAIDSQGRIVGVSFSSAFIWEDGVMSDLGTLGGYARAYGINDLGQVVGYSRDSGPGGDGLQKGWIWEDGEMTELPPLPERDNSQAFGINALGDVVGSSWYPVPPYGLGVDQATLWRANGEIVDLGQTPGYSGCSIPTYPDNIALAVNIHGQVVGHAQCISSGGALAGFLYDDGVMHNLNDLVPGSGWDLIKAWDINDRGEIVGYGLAPGGGEHLRAFLLQPTSTAVEEEHHATEEDAVVLRAHPNPFRRSIRLSLAFAKTANIRLSVHDVLGRRVAVLADGVYGEGEREVIWRGENEAGLRLASGIYVLRLASDGHVTTRRLVLLR